MSKSKSPDYRIPFPALRASRAFDKALQTKVREAVDRRLAVYISPDNSHAMYHGLGWTHQRKDDVAAQGTIEHHRAEAVLETRDIVAHDLSVLSRFTHSIVEGIGDQTEKELFGMIIKTADEVGNVVHREPGMSLIDVVIAAVDKVGSHVGKDGKISEPTVPLSPEDMARLRQEVAADEEGFQKRLDEVLKKNSEKAIREEEDRVARFPKRSS